MFWHHVPKQQSAFMEEASALYSTTQVMREDEKWILSAMIPNVPLPDTADSFAGPADSIAPWLVCVTTPDSSLQVQ